MNASHILSRNSSLICPIRHDRCIGKKTMNKTILNIISLPLFVIEGSRTLLRGGFVSDNTVE